MPHTFDELRSEYPEFLYTGYETSYTDAGLEVIYRYEIPGLSDFHTRWVFPATRKEYTPVLKALVFSLGMAEAISYYKITCPRNVKVLCGSLDGEQISWWEKLFYKGLGEFQYVNGIDVPQEELLKISWINEGSAGKIPEDVGENAPEDVEGGVSYGGSVHTLHDPESYDGILVPIGGGKDSVVSLELLKGRKIYTYSVNQSETIRNVIACCDHAAGDLAAKRILDKRIIEFNEQGYLNGHIPFSSVVAFSCVITAYLNGIRHIALSNESSANESTVRDSFVNHQYSKTFEFEKDFDGYIKNLTDSDIHYFSLLRPYTELKIASMFAKSRGYHKAFRSCNRGSKQGIWCCNCPKCLFVYIILSPFLTEEELIDIFGEKLLDKDSLDTEFKELTGISENKPFECVGMRSEVCASIRRFISGGKNPVTGKMIPPGHSLLTDRYADIINTWTEEVEDILSDITDEHNIPDELRYTIDR